MTTLDIDTLVQEHEERVAAVEAARRQQAEAQLAEAERCFARDVTAWLGPFAALLQFEAPHWDRDHLNQYFRLEGKQGCLVRKFWDTQSGPFARHSTHLEIGTQQLALREVNGAPLPIEDAAYGLPAFLAAFRKWKLDHDADQRVYAHSRELHALLSTRDVAALNAALPAFLERYPELKETTLLRAGERIEHLLNESEAEAQRARSRAAAETARKAALELAASVWRPFLVYKVTYGATDRDSGGAELAVQHFYSLAETADEFGWWSKVEQGLLTRLRVFNLLAVEELRVVSPHSALARELCALESRDGARIVYPPEGARTLPSA